jgi:zinc transporter ZupT
MFLLEILITAVIISIPLGVVCSLVALFFFPNWWAVAYGFLFGFAAGVLFGLLRTYFFAQSLRKPLQ